MPVNRAAPLGNYLLEAAPPDTIKALKPYLQHVPLSVGHCVFAPMKAFRHVYFPTAGMISVVAAMKDGSTVEVGIVGKDGMAGISLVLGVEFSRNEGVVQAAGAGYMIKAPIFSEFLRQHPEFHRILLRYVEARMSQVSITAACNRLHHVEERLARWLLTVCDRLESQNVFLTQEFIASMLGVRRAGVTIAAGTLQRAGIIDYRRGRMRILDREKLEATACECYEMSRSESSQILNAPVMAPSAGAQALGKRPDGIIHQA